MNAGIVAVYIVVLHVSAYGYQGVIVPENPEFRIAFERESDCRAAAPAIARAVKIPSVANLDAVKCQRMEIRR